MRNQTIPSINNSVLQEIKLERKRIQVIMKKSPVFKNPVIFMMLLDCIGMIITIVATVHIKTNQADESGSKDSKHYEQFMSNFRMSIALIVLQFVRMVLMIVGECVRSRYYSSRIEVKHNYQVLIFIARYLYTLLTIFPFIVYCYFTQSLDGLPFWLPTIILAVEEVPGFMFVIYLSVVKDSQVKSYLQKQQKAKALRENAIKNTEMKCEHNETNMRLSVIEMSAENDTYHNMILEDQNFEMIQQINEEADKQVQVMNFIGHQQQINLPQENLTLKLQRDDSVSVENEEYKDQIDQLDFFYQIRDRNHSMPLNRFYDPNNRFKMFNSNNQLQRIDEENGPYLHKSHQQRFGSFHQHRPLNSDRLAGTKSEYQHKYTLRDRAAEDRKYSFSKSMLDQSYIKTGSTKAKSCSSCHISESWSPNDAKVINRVIQIPQRIIRKQTFNERRIGII
ncbi:UNKNOWN [Stylonychia lemnae]|uniref:Transmembrane protein n=1 Tax=Stylonychia lemnae TaxID=5949 RepID=A0A077ZNA7_STYLE|nr:UNKNOWN [Stylonychia lemnae]|eukprot:CDW71467.1 UNKNOWN [Stylonychia lemnae]